jgi:hypothetical protein
MELQCKHVINSAGLTAPWLARMLLDPAFVYDTQGTMLGIKWSGFARGMVIGIHNVARVEVLPCVTSSAWRQSSWLELLGLKFGHTRDPIICLSGAQSLDAIYSANRSEERTPERNDISNTHARASSEQACESMASSSENFCRNTLTVATINHATSLKATPQPATAPPPATKVAARAVRVRAARDQVMPLLTTASASRRHRSPRATITHCKALHPSQG